MFDRIRRLFGGAAPAGPERAFLAEVLSVVNSLGDGMRAVPVTGLFAVDISCDEQEPSRFYLHNVFAETRELSPDERRKRIAFFASVFAARDRDPSWADAREQLVPVIRPATYDLAVNRHDPAARMLRRPFLPYLDLVVAIDQPRAMAFVNRNTIEKWKIDEDELFRAAWQRVDVLREPTVRLHDDTHGPLFVVTTNDSYEACRLLVPGWLASFRDKVEGAPIAIIPERSTLMVAGDRRPEMLERLIEKAEREFAASNRRLSPALYATTEDGRVVPYERPDGDPFAGRVRAGHQLLAEYEESQLGRES